MARFVFDRERQEVVPKPEPEGEFSTVLIEPTLRRVILTDFEEKMLRDLYGTQGL